MNTTNAARLTHLLFIALTLFTSCGKNNSEMASSSTTPPPATRIVSFAPSITEILYELGLGDKVCGVTQFCKYPPDAAKKEKIGGQIDHNYEAVVRLNPDMAVILKEQSDMIDFFDRYSIRYVVVGSDSVDEILESIQSVASACYVADRGRAVVENLRKQMGPIKVVNNSGKIINTVKTVIIDDAVDNCKPKVLLCVSRDGTGTGAIGKCFVAGAVSFYDQLIEAAGGVNVMNAVKQAYPSITAEAVVRLAPDVIIELSMSYTDNQRQQQKNCDDWKSLKNVPAVKNDRIYCLSGGYLTIPGPRIGLILEDFKNALRQR